MLGVVLGAVTLTGANSYAGGTFVNGGTLIGNTSSLRGAITVTGGQVQFAQATDGTLKALINVGPTNPKEFSEVTSTTDMLKPLAQATGGDARRIVDGGSLDMPRIVPVRAASVFRGDGWMGVKMRDASVVKGVGVLPIFAGLIGLLLLLGAFAATWLREGR